MDSWTSEPPTKPGWYWHKDAESADQPGDPHVRRLLVYEWQCSLYVSIVPDDRPLGEYHPQQVSTLGGLWMWCKPLFGGLKDP